MTSRLLITTSLEQTWALDSPHTFLGRWCFGHFVDGIDETAHPVEPYHWDDRGRAADDYLHLRSLYERMLVDLTAAMNALHGVDRDVRYWRILLGPWLGYMVQVLYDRWQSIENAAQGDADYHTVVVEFDTGEFIANDFKQSYEMILSDRWNHYIYGEIIKQFPAISVVTEPPAQPAQPAAAIPAPAARSLGSRLFSMFKKACRPLVRESDNVFISTSLPLVDQIKLQLGLKQFPMVYTARTETEYFPPQANLRSWKFAQAGSAPQGAAEISAFEIWLRGFLPGFVPAVFLEGYQAGRAKVDASDWPARPKVIWTSSLYNDHEFFKLWAAEKIVLGAKLVIGQHGGNFGMAKWNFSEDHQVDISDAYFSWGWADPARPKVIPVGQLKRTPEAAPSATEKLKAMLVTMELPRYSYFMMSSVIAGQWLDYMQDQFSFIGGLPETIRDQMSVRLKPRKDGWRSADRWKSKFPDIDIDPGTNHFHDEAAACKLVVSTYNAATYLETLAMNIPTVVYWNPAHWELRPDAQTHLDSLKAAGIFHPTAKGAAEHVARIWDDVDGWWNTAEVQSVRARFCKQYSSIEENMMDNIQAAIRELATRQ